MARQWLSSVKEEELVLEKKERENPSEEELIEETLRKARLQFTFTCLKKVKGIKLEENLVFSPYDIYNALLLVYFASKDAIEELLKQILCLSNTHFPKNKLMEYYSSKKTHLQSKLQACAISSDYNDDSYCWITNMNCLNLTKLQRIFRDKLEVFDFRNNLRKVIHRVNWMMVYATNGFIRDPPILKYDGDTRDGEKKLILTTVVRLKHQKFQKRTPIYQRNKRTITSSTIYKRYRLKQVLYSRRTRKTYISLDLGFYVTEFPYRSNNTSLFVLLPMWYVDAGLSHPPAYRNVDILTYMIEKLSSEEGWSKLCKLFDGDVEAEEFDDCKIDPTFELEKDLPMHELLEALGAKELVQDAGINVGDFVAEHNKELHLSRAMHRSNVKVTEDDIIAGAMTAFYSGTGLSRPDKDERNFESFLWLIYDKLHRIVLFAGTINKQPPQLRQASKEIYV